MSRHSVLGVGWLVPGGKGTAELGTVTVQDAAAAASANSAWLEDCSARLLCVLALDRFGDYVSDKVQGGSSQTSLFMSLGLMHTAGITSSVPVLCHCHVYES